MHVRTTTLIALLLAACLTLSSPVLSAEGSRDLQSLVELVEPPTTEVAGFLLHRPLPLLVLHGFHRRNFRQFLPYKLMLNPVYNTQSFF